MVGQMNIEQAVMWQGVNSIINSGILDDISNFTVDTQYLGSYPFGNGLQNYRAFRTKILDDYGKLINFTKLENTSIAIFIDNKMVFADGGTITYNGNTAPYEIIAYYNPIIIGWFILPNYDLYVVYNLSRGNFVDAKLGTIINASKWPAYGISPRPLSNGYCIYVLGSKANGTICYAGKMTLPYVVKTPNYWGGYNVTIYWGEVRDD